MPQYNAPVAPVAPPAPVQPAPQRIEPSYNYNPPAYTPPKRTERAETYQPEAPKKAPVRPRETVPQENVEDRYERNRTVKPPQYKTPHLQDDYGDDSAVRPWNKPVAKGVPPCAAPKRGSVCAHTVQAGETLSSIAQERYGFGGPKTVARIVAVNPGLHPDRIYIGQVLYMPCSCGMAAVPERESEPETSYRYAPSNRISAGSVQFIPIVAY